MRLNCMGQQVSERAGGVKKNLRSEEKISRSRLLRHGKAIWQLISAHNSDRRDLFVRGARPAAAGRRRRHHSRGRHAAEAGDAEVRAERDVGGNLVSRRLRGGCAPPGLPRCAGWWRMAFGPNCWGPGMPNATGLGASPTPPCPGLRRGSSGRAPDCSAANSGPEVRLTTEQLPKPHSCPPPPAKLWSIASFRHQGRTANPHIQ